MENAQQNIIAIGRKRFPIEEIALVEPFEPPAEQSPRFTSDKEFKARVVLIDRYNVLTEDTVEAFAEANKFRRLPDDNVATNRRCGFGSRPSSRRRVFSHANPISPVSNGAIISRRNAVSTAGTPTRHRGKASKFASGSSKATNSRRPSEDYLPL